MKRFALILCAVALAALFTTTADACTKARRQPVRNVVKAVVGLPFHVVAKGHDRRVERRAARHEVKSTNACSPEVCTPAVVEDQKPKPKKREKKHGKRDSFQSIDTFIGPAPCPGGRCKR
jgi:hypothetical protein